MTPTTSKPRRGRPRKVESIAEWMTRIDAEVEAAARQLERKPPSFADLIPEQRRIVELLIEHMRTLPLLAPNVCAFQEPTYASMNRILTELFKAKYPSWKKRTSSGNMDASGLPGEENATLERLLRRSGGMTSATVQRDEDND